MGDARAQAIGISAGSAQSRIFPDVRRISTEKLSCVHRTRQLLRLPAVTRHNRADAIEFER